jgi:hypothetical protein
MGKGFSEIVPIIAGLLDFLLNVVGLLLWFNWRASGIKLAAPGVVSLAATIQRTDIIEPRRWFSFACLIALLIIRALLYCQIGSRVNWIATLDLTAITLPFRSDMLSRMFLFSVLSFSLALGIVYASLLLLSVVNEKSRTTDYFPRLIALQLGWIGKWFWPIRFVLAPIVAALLWMALSGLFVKSGIIPPPKNAAHEWQIAGVLALCLLVTWKYVLILFLGLHLLNTYVYLGNSSFWQFVTLTGNRLCLPLRWLPLRIGKLDLASPILIVGILIGSHYASNWLIHLYPRLPL